MKKVFVQLAINPAHISTALSKPQTQVSGTTRSDRHPFESFSPNSKRSYGATKGISIIFFRFRYFLKMLNAACTKD